MREIARFFWLCLLTILLAGCIEQNVTIKLNADGSGTLTIQRHLSSLETGITMLGEDEIPTFDEITVVSHSLHTAPGNPGRKVEKAEYSFTNLGEALPELENLIPLMPRFSIQDDRLAVSVSHEMNEYHGFSSEGDTNNFYHLEMEFPVPPQSTTGRIEETRVSWDADQTRLKEFQKSDIGTVLFECSIPADAIQLDLEPRLVEPREMSLPGQDEQDPELISSLNVIIPIISKGTSWAAENSNATLGLYLPVDPNKLPLCYNGLKIRQLIIDGREVAPDLKSEPSGVFSGTDAQGEDAPGVPVELTFGWNSHLLKRIDRVEVIMNAAVPEKISQHKLPVDSAAPTNSVLYCPQHPEERIAVIDIDHTFWQTAKLTLATNLKPTDLSMVYLDTEYGLRYPAKGITWTSSENMNSYTREPGENVFGKETPFYIVELYYPHIPTTSFELLFSQVQKLTMKELVLSEENIDVK